jgi:hypothetical protein
MFESEDDLNFYRKEGIISKTLEITLEAKADESPENQTGPRKQQVKVGASVLSEHIRKEDNMTAIRTFLSKKNPLCCSRGPSDPCGCNGKLCFGVFEDCKETPIENLRLKYFSPHISKKGRRDVLVKELQSIVQVLKFLAYYIHVSTRHSTERKLSNSILISTEYMQVSTVLKMQRTMLTFRIYYRRFYLNASGLHRDMFSSAYGHVIGAPIKSSCLCDPITK